MPRTERPARVQATPATNPEGSSLSPDDSIRAANSQQIVGFVGGNGLFRDAQEYQRVTSKLERLAKNYPELKWPEEGALKECVTLAAMARSARDRAVYLRECAQFAAIVIDRCDAFNPIDHHNQQAFESLKAFTNAARKHGLMP